jgi:hypothetical protein
MSEDLAAWLRKQVEARKATAVAALHGSDGHWWRRLSEETSDPVGALWDGEPVVDEDGDVLGGRERVVYDEGRPSDAQFGHIAANDPRDTIARCEAELAVLDEHTPYVTTEPFNGRRCVRCASDKAYPSGVAIMEAFPCRTVRLIGYAYRFRPGYREAEWKP